MFDSLSSLDDSQRKPSIIPLEFWKDYLKSDDGTYKEVEWVRWSRKGSNNTTEDKIVRVQKQNNGVWEALEPHYKAWQKGEKVEIDGTPIDVCSFFSREQLKMLKQMHIVSAEEFATASDSILEKLGIPGVRALQAKTQAFLNAQGASNSAEEITKRDEKIDTLTQELAELRDAFKKMNADKPKPGRKPKSFAEAYPDAEED